MLPGEEDWLVDRLYRSLPSLSTLRSLVRSSDGTAWWADPQLANVVLLSVITLLIALRFASEGMPATPRRIVRGLRRLPLRRRRPSGNGLTLPRPQSSAGGGRLRAAGRQLRRTVAAARGRRGRVDFDAARHVLSAHLDRMVGLARIKAHLWQLLDMLEMDERRCQSMPGFVSQRGCMHMVFLGSPGSGKTAVAQLVAGVLREIGVLRRGQLVVAKKADLLGRYSNHVAKNTRAMVQRALGGVLFIDEAYSLLQGEAELGREVLNVLVDLCYAHKDDLVVVLAGYADTMADLFEANAGLASRFPHKFFFDDYSEAELARIARLMLEQARFTLADGAAAEALERLVAPIAREVPCGNARSVENRIAAAIGAQSHRLRSGAGTSTDDAPPTESSLFELTAADLDEACRVANRANAVLGGAKRAG